jgi:hypothetical protein
MTDTTDQKPKNSGSDLIVRATLLIASLVTAYLWLRKQTYRELLGDFRPIINALIDQSQGIDVYLPNSESMFIYHPYVLNVLTYIDDLYPLKYILPLAYIVISLFFLYQTYQFLKIECGSVSVIIVLFVAFCFSGLGLSGLYCGNFSAYFHLAILGLIFNYIRTKSTFLLYVLSAMLLVCVIVKPYFLAYMLLFFLVISFYQAVVISIGLTVSAMALWFSAQLIYPTEYARFLNALHYQVVLKNDLGAFSSVRLTEPYLGVMGGFLLHLTIMGIILLYFCLSPRIKDYFQDLPSKIMALAFFIVILNPRLAFYDFYICVVTLFLLILMKFPRVYPQVFMLGLPFAIYSQYSSTPSRWVAISLLMVLIGFCYATLAASSRNQVKQ